MARQNLPIKTVDFHASMAPIQQLDKVVTAAQVLTLYSAPTTIIAAPGAGKVIQFLGARVSLDYGSAAYSSPGNMLFNYTDGSGATVGTMTGSGFFDATADKIFFVAPASALAVANAALVVAKATENMADGDSPLNLRVYYRIVPAGL